MKNPNFVYNILSLNEIHKTEFITELYKISRYIFLCFFKKLFLNFSSKKVKMKIPFVDLQRQYLSIKEEVNEAISFVLNSSSFVGGRYLAEFERNFSKEYGFKYFFGVGNGTDALFIALKALGIGFGDEVITVCNTWISSAETITLTGAKPVFVDIEREYYNVNPALIEGKITERTKAIIVVHLYGQAADIIKIKQIAHKYNLYLIEDCAQAHFAKFNNIYVGKFGDVAAFSFYPSKNLGAYGDGGGIGTDNEELYYKMKMFANHGSLTKYEHLIEGFNSRLDDIQAAVLNVKLRYIHEWNELRRKHAKLYGKLLANIPEVELPKIRPNAEHVFHIYTIRAQRRDQLYLFLKQNGIGVSIHYPKILPLQPAYEYLKHKPQDFPVGYEYQGKILSLPMYPELKEEEIEFIANKIRQFYGYK